MCPHYKVTPISRANGGSIVERADYALCRGQHADKAAELVASGQAGPVIDWQAIAAAEDRSTRHATAKEGRTFVIALPCELDLPSLVRLAQEHADWLRAEHGFVVEWGIQIDPGNPNNPHLHLATSSRVVDDQGKIGKKVRVLDQMQTGAARIEAMRHQWEVRVNAAMAAAGRTERLDMRSFVRQGRQDDPTRHLGPVIAHRVEKGLPSERHARNESIRDARRKYASIRRGEQRLAARIRQRADRALKRGKRVSRRAACSLRSAADATERLGQRQRGGPATLRRVISQTLLDHEHHLQPADGRDRDQREPRASEKLDPIRHMGVDGGVRPPSQPSQRPEAENGGPARTGSRAMSTRDLLTEAKLNVDLPGFLALHGYRPVAEKDCVLDRRLDGPGGKLLVSRRDGTKEWLWVDIEDTRRGGSILDACTMLLGMSQGQAYGELRRQRENPPPPLPPSRGRSTTTAAPTSNHEQHPARTLPPLSEIAAQYLMGPRCLDLSTVQAFMPSLRSDPDDGHLIAAHNDQGDGEKHIPLADGSVKKRFVGGNRLDGAGRGRSIWHASPQHSEPAAFLIVGDTPVDAISLWQRLDPEVQLRAVLVSTGGSFSVNGELKLERVAKQAGRECRRAYQTNLVIMDASDVGEATTPGRETTLRALAAAIDAEYERWASPVGKDWNDAVKADKHAQEAAQAAESVSAYLLPEDEQDEAQEGPRPGGRGR